MSKHTPGPWEWRKNGHSHLLWGAHGMRPIIIDVGRVTGVASGKAILRMRDDVRDVMVEASSDHPDARLIAAAPTLLDALRQARIEIAWMGDEHGCCASYASESIAKIDAAIALAEGGGK